MLLALSGLKASAQQDLTIYNMRYIPQASYSNAAFIPEAKVYFGMPGMSGLYFNASHNGFKWKDLVEKEMVGDSFKLNLTIPNALNSMRPLNLFTEELRMDLFNFGLKLGDNHIGINVTSRQTFSFAYSRDLFALLLVGNGLTAAESKALYGSENYGFLDKAADLSGSGINFSQYTEIGFKYTRVLMNEKLTIGVRQKLLLGSVNFQTKKTNFTLQTDPASFALTGAGGYEFNSSVPSGFLPDSNGFKFSANTMFGSNIGFGLDVGATFKLTEKFEVNAAANDLGYISWKGNPKNYIAQDFQIEFRGLTGFEDQLLSDPNANQQATTDTIQAQLSNLVDTLVSAFLPDTTYNAYTTGIGAKFNVGARYALTKRQSVAGMISVNSVAHQLKPALSLAYNFRFHKWFGFTAAYNAYNNSFTNIGAGLSFNIFPLQIHVISDNIFSIDPSGTKNVNVRFGMNWVFGHDKKELKGKRNF